MSRSYKHFPYCKDVNSSKWGKRYYNKQIRKMKKVPSRNAYRRMTNKYDYIYDYCSSEIWEEYKHFVEHPRWWMEPEEAKYFDYYKYYLMK